MVWCTLSYSAVTWCIGIELCDKDRTICLKTIKVGK